MDKEGQVVVAWVGGSGDRRAYKPQDLYKVESEVLYTTVSAAYVLWNNIGLRRKSLWRN